MKKRCKICGIEFQKKPKETYKQWGKRLFCSKKCSGKNRTLNGNGPTYIEKVCEVCGKIFTLRMAVRSTKTCSHSCHSSLMSLKFKGSNNPFFNKKHTPETRAKLKTKTFRHTDSAKKKMSIARKGRKFSDAHRRNISKGLYKGSTYKSEKEKIRKSFEYKEWRRAVFKRDNYTCCDCGKKKCYIEAHHIKKFSEYKELIFDVDNGLTLCKKCHKKITSLQMKGNKNGLKKTKQAS